MRIPRHKPDFEFCEEVLEEHREDSPRQLARARLEASNLSSVATDHLSIVSYASVVCPDSDEIPRYLGLASRALAALFRTSRCGQPVTCDLGYGEPQTYSAPADESLLDAGKWISAFYLGLIRRDKQMLDELCLISVDELRRSSTRHPEYRYRFAKALRGYWLEDRKAGKYMLAAMKATNPKKHRFHNEMHVLKIDVPIMQLFFYVLSEDARFEEAAVEAIKRHKSYWGTSSRRDDRLGFISFGLTAMLALGKENGLPFEIESEYTPGRLVSGDFTDEVVASPEE